MTEPINPQDPLRTGGMLPRGATTMAAINKPGLDPQDQAFLCNFICQCNQRPNIGSDGRSLKQVCVSTQLKTLDKLENYKSIYKAEVSYDMGQDPPQPIMDSDIETKSHDWIPGWLQKKRNKPDENGNEQRPFKRGQGMIRRPDVIIVKDPTQPPIQENIKNVVEIKFPGDTWGRGQKESYITIAGNGTKLEELEPKKCGCGTGDNEPETSDVPINELKEIGILGTGLYMLMNSVRAVRTIRPAAIP